MDFSAYYSFPMEVSPTFSLIMLVVI